MENYWDKCVLICDGGKYRRSIPHHPSTNTPTFFSAPSSKSYRIFAATYEACSATSFDCECVLQSPSLRENTPEEFLAKENFHLHHRNYPNTTKVREDDDTVRTSNKSGDLPFPYSPSDQAERRGALTFDPSPPPKDNDDTTLAALDDQVKLM
jgi:hypothetical protein